MDETYTTFGVTVYSKKLEQSAILVASGGEPFVPVTARAQLSAKHAARWSSTAAELEAVK